MDNENNVIFGASNMRAKTLRIEMKNYGEFLGRGRGCFIIQFLLA